jgi:protein subunit release factor B
MQRLNVSASDIEERFVRSSGPGGQNVNKVSTCVVLVHRPTGLSVKCQESRSQGLNRFYARRILLDKIERQQRGFVEVERQRLEKIRRQKRKRSKRAKEKMLEHKHRHSEKKKSRGRLSTARLDAHF